VTISLAATNLNWPAGLHCLILWTLPFLPPFSSFYAGALSPSLLLHLVVGLYLLLAPQLLALTTDPLLPLLPSLSSSQFMSNMKICVACPFFAFPPSPYFCPCFFFVLFWPVSLWPHFKLLQLVFTVAFYFTFLFSLSGSLLCFFMSYAPVPLSLSTLPILYLAM